MSDKAQEYFERGLTYNEVYQQGRTDVLEEFTKKLKSDEFQKYNIDMVFETSRDLSYSNCVNAFEEYIDAVAEQLKDSN